MVHTRNGLLFGHQKDEVLPFVTTWNDLESIMRCEVNQIEKNENHIITLICVKQKQQMNEQAHRHRQQYGGYQRGKGCGG